MLKLSLKLKTSIFLKLFYVLTATGFLIIIGLLVGFSFAMRPHFDHHFDLVSEQFARYLMADLGPKPDLEKAEYIANRLGIGIRIEAGTWVWSSRPDLPPIHTLPPLPSPPKGLPFFKSHDHNHLGHFVVLNFPLQRGPAKILVTSPGPPTIEADVFLLFLIGGFVLLVLVGSYLLIRRMLSPIHRLTQAVSEFGAGKLDQKIPPSSNDELGRLAEAFNAMAVRIKEMIYSRQQLLIDISHELRSPLTRAKIGLELLEENETVVKAHEDLNEIERMIEELLESARLDSDNHGLQLEPTDLGKLVSGLVNQYAALGKPVQVAHCPENVFTYLDIRRFKSVITNLIENALKYSDGQNVRLFIDVAEQISIEVRDQGKGIPSNELDLVFEPFYRVDKSRNRKTGGFGLGLSLCKKIVSAHGGTISLNSQLNHGTSVRILLPIPADAATH